MAEIKSLKNLTHELSRLPGIGEKSAQRLAYFLLKKGVDFSENLRQALRDIHEKIKLCPTCFSYTENRDLCDICEDVKRQQHILCIVESPSDIMKIDSSNVFQGRYHVLHGVIAPLEGVLPEHLKIEELVRRIDQASPPITEIILALDANLEGDTTALYVSKILQNKGLKVTRLAYGIPFGSDIDYIDRRTLGKAIENRIEV